MSGRGSPGDVALEMGLDNGQDFHRWDREGHQLQAMAQSRTATVGLTSARGAMGGTAVPLSSPFSTLVSLVPPTFLGSVNREREDTGLTRHLVLRATGPGRKERAFQPEPSRETSRKRRR